MAKKQRKRRTAAKRARQVRPPVDRQPKLEALSVVLAKAPGRDPAALARTLTRRIAFASAAGASLDAVQLDAALGAAISPRTRALVAANPEPLRAAMLLGGPDFMQR